MKFVHNVRTCNFVGLFDCLTCFKSRSFKLVSQFHVWYKYFSGWSPLSFLFGSPKPAPFHPLPCGSCLKVLGSILITNCCLRFCIEVQLLLNQASSPLRAFWSVWWMNASWFEWVRYELDLILSYLLSPLFSIFSSVLLLTVRHEEVQRRRNWLIAIKWHNFPIQALSELASLTENVHSWITREWACSCAGLSCLLGFLFVCVFVLHK